MNLSNMKMNMNGVVVLLVVLAAVMYGGTMGAVIAIALIGVVALKVLKIGAEIPPIVSVLGVVGIIMFAGLIPAGVPSIPTGSLVPTVSQPQVGQLQSATLKMNFKDANGAAYGGSGVVYGLHSGVVSDRYSLMKMLYDGKTAGLTPNTMTLASGVESYSGFTGKIGDTVTIAGYLDTTPAAAENISFVKTVVLTGITSGSTPEWMVSEPQFVWHNYPTLLFYNDADAAKTVYNENESAATEKTLTFTMYPTNNGEQWVDSSLYIEAPSANAGAFKKIHIVSPDGQSVDYTSLQSTGQMSSSDPRFIAAPALTNGNSQTDTMYFVGKFPTDSIRTSTTEKAKMTVTVTYDHPASGDVYTYFKVVSNSNALTNSGGHIDTPSTNLNLRMNSTSAGGSDGWS